MSRYAERRRDATVVAVTFAALLSGCVSVPPEAPAAAQAIDARLERFEDAHVALLGALFDTHRGGLERFVETRWQPRFVDEFLAAPENAALVDALADSASSAADRRAWFALVLPALQRAVDAERRSLVEPLERLETEATRQARDAFADARLLARALAGLLVAEEALARDGAALPAAFGIGEGTTAALASDVAMTAGALAALISDLQSGRVASTDAAARLESLQGGSATTATAAQDADASTSDLESER